MERDKLEKYISEHKNEFDQDSPPPMVWLNLEKHLDIEHSYSKRSFIREIKKPSIMRIMQVAAMFVVVMGVGLLIGLQLNKGNIYSNPQLEEFVEAEKHYSKEIDKMWTVVKASSVEEKETIQEDLNGLDAIYNELKNELISNPNANTDYVVNAMIENYRTKIDILETVLNKYNKKKIINKQIKLDNEKLEI